MQVAHETIDERTQAVTVSGELVGSSGLKLVRMTRAALDGGAERIVVDLTGMTFMDSGGLAALIASWSATMEAKCRFAVVLRAESHAARSLELRGVADVFAVAATREAALAIIG